MGTIHAIYENGVFKPTAPVALPDACEVEFEPRVVATPVAPAAEPPDPDYDPNALQRGLAWLEGLKNRTDAELEEDRRRLFALSPPPRPIPEGKTLSDMVEGKWPGDETDDGITRPRRREPRAGAGQ